MHCQVLKVEASGNQVYLSLVLEQRKVGQIWLGAHRHVSKSLRAAQVCKAREIANSPRGTSVKHTIDVYLLYIAAPFPICWLPKLPA